MAVIETDDETVQTILESAERRDQERGAKKNAPIQLPENIDFTNRKCHAYLLYFILLW